MEDQTHLEELTKKERKDQKRAQKQKAYEKAIATQKLKKTLKWVVSLVVVVGLVYWGFIEIQKYNASRPGEQVSVQGGNHISVGQEHEEYNTNPPTSGAHGSPVNFGIYTEELPDENMVHNIEHGGIWISYTGISEEEIAQLEEIAQRHPRSVVLAPRSANDTPIAIVSWGRLMKLDAVDEELIEEYIKRNINKSPEPLVR